MENYFYKCPTCGYVHIVPAYWVSFAPEDEMDVPHVHRETKEVCISVLRLVKNE